jgi:drug/metabolite transporter (DMT)-like permease
MTATADRRAERLNYHWGLVLVLAAGAVWSTTGLGIRLIDSASSWQILFYRSLGLAGFLIAATALRGTGRPLATIARAGPAEILGGVALVAAFVGSVLAIRNATVANAMFLFAAAPFFAALLGWLLLGERVRPATWIAIAVAICGIGIMVADAMSTGQLLGNAAALMSALGFAGLTLALRWGRANDMTPALFYGALFTGLVTGAVCLGNGDGLAVTFNDGAISLALGVAVIGLGMFIFTIGSRVVPAAELALLAMTEVLLGPLWVFIFLGETAGVQTWVGGAILLSAIVLNALSGLRRAPPAGGMH